MNTPKKEKAGDDMRPQTILWPSYMLSECCPKQHVRQEVKNTVDEQVQKKCRCPVDQC
jgi:hypothetical protein